METRKLNNNEKLELKEKAFRNAWQSWVLAGLVTAFFSLVAQYVIPSLMDESAFRNVVFFVFQYVIPGFSLTLAAIATGLWWWVAHLVNASNISIQR